ncbi:YegJ family protein [Neisseria sp. Ec49-e6-T10]|uniref:YegJ family protein n=1 Tax=Neisseria sp. Ec49-e6-T10 TaxID=3140744 RepID=UPI003EB9FD91
MKYKNILIISLLIILLGACTETEKAQLANTNDTEDPVVYFKHDDKAMNKAIQTARTTFHQFEKAFNENDTNQYSGFTIKVGFPTQSGSKEHIWVSDIQYDKKNYSGIIYNTPVENVGFEYGDTITAIEQNQISDWMFTDTKTNKTYGGYTVRVMRDAMSDAEKQAFDQETGLNFAE